MHDQIVVVGSINMDLVVRAPRHPQPGETILGAHFRTFPGGKGANQAVAAARLGGQVHMIGRVGDDAFGDSLLATLQRDSVDTQFVLRSPNTASGVALITVNDEGQNTIVVIPGANGQLGAADIQAAESVFKDAAVVVCQLEIPLPAVIETARLAHRHGAKFLLNPAPARSLDSSLLDQVDFLIPNEQELALLTGLDMTSIAADALHNLGVKCLIVTLGSEGVLVVEQEQKYHLQPFAVEVVDTTAAGDAFVGAFALALTQGKEVKEAAIWGNAAGALAVSLAGAQPSLPAQPELEKFLLDHPTQIDP